MTQFHFLFILLSLFAIFYFGVQAGKEVCISAPSDCVSWAHPDGVKGGN